MIKKFLKEPLVQFLVISLVLLGGERWINAEDYAYDQYHIQIDDQQLLQFNMLLEDQLAPRA